MTILAHFMERSTHLLCDIDGVIRREGRPIEGVSSFFQALHRSGIRSSLLSNNSRQRGSDVVQMLCKPGFDVAAEDLPGGLSSADATAMWMSEHPSSESPAVYVVGDIGIRDALREIGISLVDDTWDGERWRERVPTDVVSGFSKGIDYPKLAGAWNAIRQGARFIGTNPDLEYRGEGGLLLPANGAALGYLRTAGQEPIVIGKPGIGMGEIALSSMGGTKQDAQIVVLGDTIDQDVALANNLRDAGWNVEAWVVLTGVLDRKSAEAEPNIARIFESIRDVRQQLFATQ